MDLVRSFTLIIIVIAVVAVGIYLATPPTQEPVVDLYHQITIDTHGINIYYLTIESNSETKSVTVVNYTYSTTLHHGEYHIEACYWNVNNTMKCESQRVWLDEDLTIEFFIGVIE